MTTILFARNQSVPPLLLDTLLTLGLKVLVIADEHSLVEKLKDNEIDAVIAFDEDLDCIKDVIRRFPMTNYALISPREKQDFHAVTEGYGFFMQIHQPVMEEELCLFTDKLRRLRTLTAPPGGVES